MKHQKKIMALLNARSEQAIPELTRVYGKLCRGIAGNILPTAEDAEETVSDTMLAVWDQIPPAQPDNLPAYISRITRNLSLSRLRSNTAAMRDQRWCGCILYFRLL